MSPRNPEKDRIARERKAQHILDSALKVMAIKGFQPTSIQDIAGEAKVSVGNVYHYFESKDEILSEVLRRGQTTYGQHVTEISKATFPPLTKLTLICSSWLSIQTSWAFTILMQSARLSDATPHEIRRAVTDRFTENLKPVASIMRDGIGNGTIVDGDPLQLAFYFVSLIQGLTLQRMPGYEVPVDMDVAAITALFEAKRPVGPPPPKNDVDNARSLV
ncbi:MAG: transcriptional regulator, TetR family [Paenibacillus sp.]|nr:transcriptional regulator, TetR family [Paenibacillus sp.]